MKKNKTIRITFRLTEEEAIRFNSDMALQGYKSRSKYIRNNIFRGRVQRRNLKRIDSNTAKQIELLRTEVNRIGLNYNQAIKSMNTFAKMRDSKGQLIVTSETIDGILTDMRKLMQDVIVRVNQIQNEISEQ